MKRLMPQTTFRTVDVDFQHPDRSASFGTGSPHTESRRDATEDKHQVNLTRDFEIQTTEVTRAQFAAMVGCNPSYFGPTGRGADCGPDRPVDLVSWHEARRTTIGRLHQRTCSMDTLKSSSTTDVMCHQAVTNSSGCMQSS